MHNITSGNPTPPRGVAAGIRRVALTTIGLLLIPLVAMRFTAEVNWGPGDFAAAALLLGGTGVAWVLAASRLATPRARRIAGAVLLLALLLVWAELAVGIFD